MIDAWSLGFEQIAGIDEAGRGPLAGPVVAAACSFPPGVTVAGVDDSKKLTPAKRHRLYETLVHHPQIDFGIGIVDATVIDAINILQATFQAMNCAIAQLKIQPQYLLVDGPHVPTREIPGEGIVDGDSRCFLIAAASILAKETRDRLMQDYHKQWPQYGFDRHKGYGTKLHLQALKLYGLTPLHRRSFRPCFPCST